MNFPLSGDECLLVEGDSSFILVGTSAELFSLCIETYDAEFCQTVEAGDLIVVSAPEGGDLRQAWMLLELVRTYHQPLLVLSKDHPGAKRLSMVVSVASKIVLRSTIRRGTHPEQHLVCSSEEMNGLSLEKTPEGVSFSQKRDDLKVSLYRPDTVSNRE